MDCWMTGWEVGRSCAPRGRVILNSLCLFTEVLRSKTQVNLSPEVTRSCTQVGLSPEVTRSVT